MGSRYSSAFHHAPCELGLQRAVLLLSMIRERIESYTVHAVRRNGAVHNKLVLKQKGKLNIWLIYKATENARVSAVQGSW